MRITISYLSGIGVRFPPPSLRDKYHEKVQAIFEDLTFTQFSHLAIYMFLPGDSNTFKGLPKGVSLRINRKEHKLEAKCSLDTDEYKELKTFDLRINMCIDYVALTIEKVFEKYKKDKELLAYYKNQLEEIKS